MQMQFALMTHDVLCQNQRKPLEDPLNGPEWGSLWRLFLWRYRLVRLCRRISGRLRRTGARPAKRRIESAS